MLALRYDARDLLALGDGGKVAAWADKSGNARDLAQAEEAKQPLLKTGVLGGRPAVRFDGKDDLLRKTGFELAQPNVIAIVGANTSVGAFIDGSSSEGRHLQLRLTEKWGMNAGTWLYSAAVPDGNPHIHVLVFNGKTSMYRFDGAIIAEGDVGAQAMKGVTLGARYDGAVNQVTGDIAEVRVYDTLLSTAQIEAVEAQLTRAWFDALGSLGGPGRALSRHNRIVNP